ncbi:hypothetical protein SGRIM128S_01471 [Streptomyces griseomycini]
MERQIDYLSEVPDKNGAFASVAGVKSSEVPSYLRSLTPLQLRVDTRVTNHGYRDGAATEYQAVLQAGTAVLVDDLGMPRVRCACGNPLTKPVEQSESRYTGKPWPGFSPSSTVVIQPAPRPVALFLEQLRTEWCATIDERVDGAVLLVVSELVTNADRHSNGPYILELEGTAASLTVAVYDSSATLPRVFPRDPRRVGRHGLEIVRALARDVSVERVPVGKCVRAVLSLDGS